MEIGLLKEGTSGELSIERVNANTKRIRKLELPDKLSRSPDI